ncbi:MAG TPA: hypothetical protein VNS12_10605 [Pelagibacterium sp.]|uniref:hypothetical protein n=1 Tax=Pelagibacterium sp. TaxID=1967288 RepID=UPI002BE8365C|nr:hypothetical protein [Pelagibacterium sp.]HWJ88511.1 hypothetical protein [Pelagibacterium sp.]
MKLKAALAAVAISLVATPSLSVANDEIDQGIRSLCEAEWEGDFAMQRYCIDLQTDGHNDFTASLDALNDDSPLQRSAAKCQEDWSSADGTTDWSMVNYCFGLQEEAFLSLQ